MVIDNMYHKNFLKGRGLLLVDQRIATDPRTVPYVRKMAADNTYFHDVFAAALVKMSENGPLTGDKRKQCADAPHGKRSSIAHEEVKYRKIFYLIKHGRGSAAVSLPLPLGLGSRERQVFQANDEGRPALWVTDAFLVDPASAVGQGAVDACVKIGNRNILLASLSAENPSAQLQTPVILEERDFIYVMPRGSDSAADANADADDAVAVQFEGFLIDPPSPESKHQRGGQEAVSYEDGGTHRADEKHADEEKNQVFTEERRRSVTARLTRTWQRGAAGSRLTRCS
ncbi:hypothetical protein QYE76_038519 [Lolium multiflorum]|uniref:Plant heme peroxidase family profile domain-containing protein n=1 Tax=Lolium multiflorum TaxID=4521 RepID=A0AAD8WSY8_LOLMU|nr:hypothetical protein QYE76_038519 [Lolium multiflorum]